MTDTPRTDALPVSDPMTEREAVLFQHARTLERENAALRADNRKLALHTAEQAKELGKLHDQLKVADARIAELEAALRSNAESAMQAHGASFEDLHICGNCNGSGYTA